MPPVIRALRLAHDETHHPSTDPNQPSLPTDAASRPLPRPAAVTGAAEPAGAGREPAVLGVRDGRAQALELAGTRGLGLVGPGAADAARALLVSLLATTHQPGAGPVTVLVPAQDAAALLPDTLQRRRMPTRLRTTRSLDTLLDEAEVDLLTRTRLTPERRALLGTLVLLATPQPHADRRLQAVLDNGITLGITAVLLGQWRPGGTVRVRADGTVAAASPDIAAALDGTRLFTLPTGHTIDLLDLLAAADPPDPDPAADEEENDDGPVAGDTHPAEPGTSNSDPDTTPTAGTSPPAGEDRQTADLNPAPARGGMLDKPSPPSTPDTSGGSSPTAGPAPFRRPALSLGPPAPAGILGAGWADTTGGPATSSAAAQPAATVRPAVTAPLRLTVLGRLHLYHQRQTSRREPGPPTDLIAALAPRQREILVYLALHRDGARREALAAAIWPNAPAERPYNSFHATLSQLRKALAKTASEKLRDAVVHGDGRYRLHPDLVDVDLWHLRDTLTTATGTTGPQQLAALHDVPALYPGDLTDHLTADWLAGPRQTLHREVLDALSTLIHTTADPRQLLAWLEHARTLDPYNEDLYRRIIDTQARLGQHDAIPRTISLLTTALADIDRQPTPDTLTLADHLQHSHATHPA